MNERPELAVAVEGEGIRPSDLTIDHLAELLEATAQTLDALSHDAIAKNKPFLSTLREGSAELVMVSAAPDWAWLIGQFYDAAKSRGVGFHAAVKRGLGRLFKAGRIGGVRISVAGVPNRAGAIHLAAPVDDAGQAVVFSRTVFGNVVGVNVYAERSTVRLQLADGGRADFEVDVKLAERAAKLFNKPVLARGLASWDGEKDKGWGLESLDLWMEGDLLETLDSVRSSLEAKGVAVDVEKWINELD